MGGLRDGKNFNDLTFIITEGVNFIVAA